VGWAGSNFGSGEGDPWYGIKFCELPSFAFKTRLLNSVFSSNPTLQKRV